MFSSKELISFVFANENDDYYGEDLLKLNLNQYLWQQLHGVYDAVYFLSAGKDHCFHVSSYGDLCCNTYTPGKKTILGFWASGSPQQDQGKWLQEQLRAKKSAVFICPLGDFCDVLSDHQWDSALASIATDQKRSGGFVLTASATAERTSDLLLESSVFEKLRETPVTDLRDGTLRDLYGTLKKRKWNSCLFLNTFSWERVHGLLLHLVMDFPERLEDASQLDMMTDYLYDWLRDPEAAGGSLFDRDLPPGYLTYKQLYGKLQDKSTWKRLEAQSLLYAQSCRERRITGSSENDAPVLRDLNSYGGRCLKLRLPRWISSGDEGSQPLQDLLLRIRSAVCTPKNRAENKQVTEAICSILGQVDTVRRGDSDTLLHTLNALNFCLRQVYTDNGSDASAQVLKIIGDYGGLISTADQCFSIRQNLRRVSTSGKLQDMVVLQMKTQLESLEKLKKTYLDLVSAEELRLNIPTLADDFTDRISKLQKEIEEIVDSANQDTTPEPEPEPVPEPPKKPISPQTVNTSNINLDSLLNDRPPEYHYQT